MISKGNKKAFTLAEIMIVLLVLTILFAIMAPLFTKKMTKDDISVWNWVDTNNSFSAYFDGDSTAAHNLLSQAFFGINPAGYTDSDFMPYSKVIIRSNDVQSKIQKQLNFRYGYDNKIEEKFNGQNFNIDESIGSNVGTMLLDTKNILAGGSYDHLYNTDSDIQFNLPVYDSSKTTLSKSVKLDANSYPMFNITFGNNAKNDLNHVGNRRVALKIDDVGAKSLVLVTPGATSNYHARGNNNIAVGYNAGTNDSIALQMNKTNGVVQDLYYNKYVYPYNNNLYMGYKAGYIQDYNKSNPTSLNPDYSDDPQYFSPYFIKQNSEFNYAEILGQTIIGSQAGYNNYGVLNTVIGYNAGKNFRGRNNVFVGANAGGFDRFLTDRPSSGTPNPDDFEVSDNVAIGYNTLRNLTPIQSLISTGGYRSYKNNVAIGAGALENLKAGYNNVAIGAGACKNLKYSANKICIGANSGPGVTKTGTNPSPEKYFRDATPKDKTTNQIVTPVTVYNSSKVETDSPIVYDTTQRIYIGGKPKNFGGDAVLEIHDSVVNYSEGMIASFLNNNPSIANMNSTTIINGNLAVRGKTFFTVGDYLYNFSPVVYRDIDEAVSPGPFPVFSFTHKYNYYILGAKVDPANPRPVVCANNPLTYTFGGYYNDDSISESGWSKLVDSDFYLHNRYDNFADGCPRVYYNSKYDNMAKGNANSGGVVINYPNTQYALDPLRSSDRRLKHIGSKNNAGLASIMKLNVFNFKFIDDEKKEPHVGVIAQDLMKIFPNSVKANEKGFLTIKLDEMFYAAINAIKELDRMIVSYTKRLFKIETEITKLEAENAELKTQVEALSLRVSRIKATRGL